MPFTMKRQRKQQRKYYLNRLQKARMNQLHSKEVSEMEAAHISPELPVRWVVSADRTVEIKEEVTELGCDQANERILQEETPPSSIAERGTDTTLVNLGRRQESEMASSHITVEAPELEPVLIKEESPELEPVYIKKEVTSLEPVHIKEESPVLEPVYIETEVTSLEPVHIKEESPVLEPVHIKEESPVLEPVYIETEVTSLEPVHIKEESPVLEPVHIKEESPELEPVYIETEVTSLEPVHIKEESPELEPVYIETEVTSLEPVHIKEESPVLEPVHIKEESPELEPVYIEKEVTSLEPVHIKEESPVLEPVHIKEESPELEPVYIETEVTSLEPVHIKEESPVLEPVYIETEVTSLEPVHIKEESPVLEPVYIETEVTSLEPVHIKEESPVLEPVYIETEVTSLEPVHIKEESPVLEPVHIKEESPVLEPVHIKEESPVLEPVHIKEESPELEPVYIETEVTSLEPVHIKEESPVLEPVYIETEVTSLEPVHIKEESPVLEPVYIEKEVTSLEPVHIKEESPVLQPVYIETEVTSLEPVHIKEESPVLEPVYIETEVTSLEPVHIKEESPELESAECEHLSVDEGEHDSSPSPHCKNSKCKSRHNRHYNISGRRCRFKEVWKQEPEYRNWLAEVNNCVHRAFCKYCRKSFDVGNMGVSALKSHMRGQGHAKAAAQLEKYEPIITSFFTFQNKETQSDQRSRTAAPIDRPSGEGMDEGTSTVPQSSVSSFALSESVLEAEIRWAVKVVLSHYSFNSCTDVSKLFSSMFPDSEIAQHFSCNATKCAYLVCFGLAPYFKERLIEEVRLSNCYAVSFNVCLNEVTQTDQVDLVISYWNEKDGKVAVRYLGSEFLGHTRAEELLESFKWSLTPLDLKKLLQMSMDGPRVKWKFLRDLEVDRKKKGPTLPDLINLGSCGLHAVHSSLQYGANETGWMLGELLGALWQLFHDTSAWRDDYTRITGSTRFPLKFCPHRWVEGLKVAERALELWPNVIQFIDGYKKLPVSKVPNSASYSLVKQAAADPLCEAKLQFFASVARQLKPFLEKFQTNAPMVPFLAEELQALLSTFLSRFIKKDVLAKANTVLKLLKIDPLDKTLHVAHKHLDLGFATNRALEQATEKLADGLRGTEFKMECITFLASTTKKLLSKNPLLNPMVRYLAALSPRFMVMSEQDATAKFERLLQILLNAKWHTAAQCEEILAAYTLFLTEIIRNHKTEFQNFGQNDSEPCRADEFFGRFFDGRPEFKKLWDLFKLLLTLSHGQTAVEQGHSVNKDMFVENLKEKTIVAQRVVRDSLSCLGENHPDLAITKKLLQHVKAAKMRYVQFLEDQKKAKTETEKQRKRKRIQVEIAGVQKKRRKVLKIISTMQKVADEMAELAEKKHDFTLLTKSNAYRKSAKEKSNETTELDAKLSELKDKAKYLD